MFICMAAINAAGAVLYSEHIFGTAENRIPRRMRLVFCFLAVFVLGAALLVPATKELVPTLLRVLLNMLLVTITGFVLYARRCAAALYMALSLVAIQAISSRLAAMVSEFVFNHAYAVIGPASTHDRLLALAYPVQLISYAVVLLVALFLIGRSFRGRGAAISTDDLVLLSVPSVLGLIVFYSLQPLLFFASYESASILQNLPWLLTLFNVISLAMLLIILSSTILYQRQLRLREKEREGILLQNQMGLLKERTEQLQQNFDNANLLRHDIKGHFGNISILAGRIADETGSTEAEQLREYVSQLGETVRMTEFQYHTGNAVTDVVLHGAWLRAEALGAAFDATFVFPAQMGIDTYDMAIVLGNGLDNALEAAARLEPSTKRWISLSSETKGSLFFLTVTNSFSGELHIAPADQLPSTTKSDRKQHGLGLLSIRKIAEKYGGDMLYAVLDADTAPTFELKVMMKKMSDD